MKFSTWPKPPVHNNQTPPEIPDRFRIFGLEYKVENGNPMLDIPSKPLDKEHIRECVNKSYNLFLKTLKTLDGNILNEIKDLHTHMTEEINKAILFDKQNPIEESKEEKARMRNEILKQIGSIVYKNTSDLSK